MTPVENYLLTIKNSMHRAKAIAALITLVRVNGAFKLIPRHEVIEARLREGAQVRDRKGEMVLMSRDGAWFDARNITKHGLNYAAWLSVHGGA